MNVIGKIVKLRAIEEKDSEILRELINDPNVEKNVGGWSFPVSFLQQKKWIESLENSTNRLNLSITLNGNDKCIGMINLVDIDWKNRSAFSGMKLIKEVRGRGVAKDSVLALMNYAFNELNLNRLDGSIIESNISSKKLYLEKCGWKQEGIKKEALFKNGRYYDNLIVGITKNEYQEFLQKIEGKNNEL